MGTIDAKETIRACRYCFMCRYACPTFKATKRESVTPRGYALLMMMTENEQQDWTDDIVRAFYQCSLCGLGRAHCEFGWAEDEMVHHARAEIVSTNHMPQAVKIAANTFLNNGNTQAEIPSLKVDKPNVEALYMTGCQTRDHNPEIITATEQVLMSIGIDWTTLGKESCCGGGLYDLGYVPEAKQKARELVEKIMSLNPAKIVTGCAHCYRTLKEFFPAWGINFPAGIQILHTSEFLNQMATEGRLKLNGKRNEASLGYHDPCMLGRKMGVFDAPRNLIQAVSDQPPIELFHNRELADCCGAGAVTFLVEPEIACKVAQLRLEKAKESGVTTLVTACQNCKTILKKVSDRESIQIIDLVELVARNLG